MYEDKHKLLRRLAYSILFIAFVLSFTKVESMLDAHQLNVFLKTSETINFTRAAKQLHMTQPDVSQHLQSLENHFKMHFFYATGTDSN